MDEQDKLVPREPAGPIEVLPAQSPIVTLDMMPHEPHLMDYVIILRKHLWLILSFLLAVVTIVTIATYRMPRIYEATARIEIDREDDSVLPFNGPSSSEAMYDDEEEYIETQSKILTSETMALQTIKSLHLDQDPRFGGVAPDPSTLTVEQSDSVHGPPPSMGAFLGGLSIRRVPNTRLLDVTFSSSDPRLATLIVNTHINNFIEQNFRSRYEETTQASNWLAGQLDELKAKVEASEDARINYERANQIWTIDDKQDVSTEKLEDINKELTGAQSDRISKEAVYQLAQSGNYDAIPAIRQNSVIQDIMKQQNMLSAQYSDALAQYGPKFPKVERLQAQLQDLDQLAEREKKNVVNEIEADYQGARQRELLLEQALDAQKAETSATANKMVEYGILQREAETDKQLYDGLLQKLKEAGISAGLRSSNIRVVDPALVPSTPTQPNRSRNITFAILVGLVGGVGLALLREYMDNTVKNPDDVERLSRLPSLAVVPTFGLSNGNGRGRLLKGANGNGQRVELVSHLQPQSPISEAFRALRTSLLLSQADRPPQVILMTSALPREGKTTAAVNLAVTLAQLGDKTLLVDGDLRKPGISRVLNMADGKHSGLSSYLAGVSTLDLVTVPHPAISNLCVIPTGPVPPNPADLLSSFRLQEMVSELRKRYKFIVIDSPPIMAATDALILSSIVDGVLIVVRCGETPKEAFMRARDLLTSVKCRMLGVVLNAVEAGNTNYYYSYRYYPYSYGSYGHEDGEGRQKGSKEEASLEL